MSSDSKNRILISLYSRSSHHFILSKKRIGFVVEEMSEAGHTVSPLHPGHCQARVEIMTGSQKYPLKYFKPLEGIR